MNSRDFGDLLFIKAAAGQSVNESLEVEVWQAPVKQNVKTEGV